MQKKIETYIREHHMIEQGCRVIAAVSGGADSVCMLHLLVSLRQIFDFKVQAVHVHHGLRGEEADRDAEYVRELSDRWEVPCLVVYENAAEYGREHGLSVEEAGRELRYRALSREAQKFEKSRIAIAHHQEDQAETILHNLFRGSGLKGLGGMVPVRDNIIRPLLGVGRREILEYLQDQGILYCEDSTNDSCDYTRNKLRHKVIPMVCQEINTGATGHIVAAGERIRQADTYFREEAQKIWQRHGECLYETEQEGQGGDFCRQAAGCRIRAENLTELPKILGEYVVMEMIGKLTGSGKDIASAHIDGILDLAGKGTGRSISLPYGLRARREYELLYLEKEAPKKTDGERKEGFFGSLFTMELLPAEFLREKPRKIPQNKYTKWFDYDKIKGTLSVRTRKTGDYFMLKGGGRKTVKAFMIDARIPREEREKIPLVADGHHILWIVGYRISEYYKITDETKQILQVKMDGGKEHEG